MIFVECDPDRVLVCSLGISRREVVHAGNKPGVCRRLKRCSNCKGLVDEDPHSVQPSYLCGLTVVDGRDGVRVLYDSRRSNFLVVLCPRLEEWVLRVAREAGVDLRNYGLPNDGGALHRMVNLKINRFRELVLALRARSKVLKRLEAILKATKPGLKF